jgi:pimeloyl-ACP methyl ester carboxylesterase
VAVLRRDDGAELHFEAAGDGPVVLLAPYFHWVPGVYDDLLARLAADHRILRYELRGTGRSSRTGPYDKDTDVGDLEALLAETGGAQVGISAADGCNRLVAVAARRPDLLEAAACVGTTPLPRSAFAGRDAMIASEAVIGAYADQLSRDYRGALRSMIAAGNPQMSRAELQERVARQVEFCSQEAALGRIAEWAGDDPLADARALGSRLWLLAAADGPAGAWFPEPAEMARLTAELLPDASVVVLEEGPVSDPAAAEAAIRRITGRTIAPRG